MAYASVTNPEHDSTLMETFGSYFESEQYLDITFLCDGNKKVKAHKLVLTSVSPFLKMLIQEWGGPPDDIIISLPEVNHRFVKLLMTFLYDGVMKLAAEEIDGFRDAMDTLCIKLPDAVITQVLPISAAFPPPPVRKLDRIQRINLEKVRRARENPSPPPPTTDFLSSEEDRVPDTINLEDDPLNVPDFYFMPSAAAANPATARGQAPAAAAQTPNQASGRRQPASASQPGSTMARRNRSNPTQKSTLYSRLHTMVNNTIEEQLASPSYTPMPNDWTKNAVGTKAPDQKKSPVRNRKRQAPETPAAVTAAPVKQATKRTRRRKQDMALPEGGGLE